MGSVPPPSERHWLSVMDRRAVVFHLGRRALDVALASRLVHATPPSLVHGAVHAVLTTPEATRDLFRVQLHPIEANAALQGECSRCAQTFGPCVHVALLALDLAFSPELREALVAGEDATPFAARAPSVRLAADAEHRFEGAIGAWLAPATDGRRIEIAASPFDEVDPYVGRAYGDRPDPGRTRALAVSVRRAGERKLLTPREILPATRFASADRRVLEHTRDRGGAGRKAVYAVGVEASLAIEAMRNHGRVFAGGFKELLGFQERTVRPAIALVPHDGARDGPPLDQLAARWVVEGSGASVPFADSAFFPGPFPFVWTAGGAIYRVALDVDLDFASQLARSPVLLVPPSRLRDAGARLLRAARGRGISLPAHEHFGLPPLETPRIVLRLSGEPLDLTGEMLAIYRAREVSLVPPDPYGEEGRDVDYESLARARAVAAGIVEPGPEGEAGDTDREARIGAHDDAAIAFWRQGLAALRASTSPPIEVELAEPLGRVRVGAPLEGRVHVALEGNWLKTRVEFASGELTVEMDAVRAALGRKKRWVSLSDGTLARITASLEALADEAAATLGRSEGVLPPHQLGRLDRWIEENDGRVDAAVQALRGRLRALAVAAEPALPAGLRAPLRPYQRRGVAWLQFLQALGAGGVLADDMGLGKTITTLAFLLRRKEAEGPAPSLVVCPTSVATNWIRESARFTPDLRAVLFHGASRDPASSFTGSDVVVTTYALLRRDLAVLAAVPFRCVILDEAQNIKNADSATARAASKLDASMRLALTGTPVENRLGELWSLASFANPGILGGARAFETRFERPIAADRQSPLAAELRAVVRPFLLRRTKKDVLLDLPPKTEIDRVVTLGRDDKRTYDALAHALRAGVARDEGRRGGLAQLSVFTALMRLRQMACDPRLVDARLGHEESPSAKQEAFLDLVRELVAEGRRALVFSQFVELLTLWRRDLDAEGIAYEYLDGSTTRRDDVITRFQEGSAPLFLISLKAGGAGLNLTAADTVIHCDPWWNPAVEDQATDRAHRIGQDKPVTVIRLVARGTIEEKILVLKSKKRELAGAVIGDDARALEGLTAEDVRALLGDGDAVDEEMDDADARGAPTDVLATATRVVDREYEALSVEVGWWLASTGRTADDLALVVDIPVPFAARLALGDPFPCSRAVADRIRARLRAW